MGIYSRDYVRESSSRGGGWGDDIPACKWLIITTVVVFILQFVSDGHGGASFIDEWFSLSADDIRSGQIWRLLTYAFLHDQSTPWHILFNMLGLWWFGSEIEKLYGTKEFTLFYLVAAVISGTGFVLWEFAVGAHNPVVGASGGVLAILTLYATHYPREKIYIYGIIPVEIRWIIAFYVIMDLWPVLRTLKGEPLMSTTAHAAHLLGILFGWLYRRQHWQLSGWIDSGWLAALPRRRRQSQARKNLRVFDPPSDPEIDLENELDRILAKIHEQGSSSLTDREQRILTKASQQYKNRN